MGRPAYVQVWNMLGWVRIRSSGMGLVITYLVSVSFDKICDMKHVIKSARGRQNWSLKESRNQTTMLLGSSKLQGKDAGVDIKVYLNSTRSSKGDDGVA